MALNKAKQVKNDEFYTLLQDIIDEIAQHPDYIKHFENKIVLMNCDDPEWSSFVSFFIKFFNKLKLKKIVSTHYNKDGSPSYKLEWSGEKINGNAVNMIKTELKGNGDFRSEECVELLKEADIIVTNPPFSDQLPVCLINLCLEHNKKFVFIGDENMGSYKNVFPLFKNGQIFMGYTKPKEFLTPSGDKQKFGNKAWFTNLELDKHHEELTLTKNYKGNESKYPKYANYDAIEVEDLKSIPKDYWGVMGVPITYLSQHCNEQFEMIEHCEPAIKLDDLKAMPKYKLYPSRQIKVNGVVCQKRYHRILIKRKKVKEEA